MSGEAYGDAVATVGASKEPLGMGIESDRAGEVSSKTENAENNDLRNNITFSFNPEGSRKHYLKGAESDRLTL